MAPPIKRPMMPPSTGKLRQSVDPTALSAYWKRMGERGTHTPQGQGSDLFRALPGDGFCSTIKQFLGEAFFLQEKARYRSISQEMYTASVPANRAAHAALLCW
jgi:hypothetical protein